MEWMIEGKAYRQASAEEIKALQQIFGAPHVAFGCLCGKGHWTAKNIALSNDGSYNGMRNIFYNGDDGECKCKASNLRCIVAA